MDLPGASPKSGHDDGAAALARMVARLAHELNEPLQVVLGQAEQALAGGAELPARLRHRLEEIQASALRAADVVHALVVYGRERRLRPTRVFPHAVMMGVLATREADFERDGVTVAHAWDGRAAVHADAPLLEEVFRHLVTNAHEAMRTGGGDLTVRIETMNGRVRIAVEDSGPGIPADARPRLFHPLMTTKGAGRGLGLAICHAIVTEHGGTIVTREMTPGAAFIIDLPEAPA